MSPQPFPYDALPRWKRTDAARLRRVVRAISPEALEATVSAEAAWRRLLGSVPTASPGIPDVRSRAEIVAAHEGISLAVVGVHPTLGVVVALLDRTPALTLAARALGMSTELADAAESLTPALEGALALLVARTVALALAPSPQPHVRGVTESVATALDAMENMDNPCFVWPWRYVAGTTGGMLTLVTRAEVFATQEPFARNALDRMRELVMHLTVVGGRAELPAKDVAGWMVGDVLTLDGLRRQGDGLEGTVDLALGASPAATVTAVMAGAKEVEITGTLGPWRRMDVNMTEDEAPAAHSATLAALTVDVVVEIAHGQVSVGEVAAWRPGEVVTLGQRLGEAVMVRAGGRLVARGELVDVEGEVGVRLSELL